MILTQEQTNNLIKQGQATGLTGKEVIDGLIQRGYEPEGVNIQAIKQSIGKSSEPSYLQRVVSGVKSEAEQNKQDLNNPDVAPLSKGISTVSHIASAVTKPLTEAPGFKQVGDVFGKGIDFLGGKLADLYSPEFQKSLADMTPEQFSQATQPLKDLANLGNIANNILLAKGGQKATEIATNTGEKISNTLENKLVPPVPPVIAQNPVIDTAKQVIKDVTPTTQTIVDRQVARAFKLSPTEDLARIEQLTGEKVGTFMDRNNLIKNTAPDSAEALVKFKKQNLNLVNDAISVVPDNYTFLDIPELKTTIEFLKNDLSSLKSAPYKQVLDRLNNIESKGNFDLMDVQYVKNAFDDIESIYKRTGDVKEKILAQDMANTISPVRRFIEARVKEFNPEIDIGSLNNNIRTSSAILDAIAKRAPKAETASLFKLGDYAVVGVGNQIIPGTGFAALFGKKILESAPIQLRIAKYLAGKTKDVIKGMSLEDIKKAEKIIQDELKSAISTSEETMKLQDLQTSMKQKLEKSKK